jgi:hypothetical protein
MTSVAPDWVQLQQKSMIRWINTKLLAVTDGPDELPPIDCPQQISNLDTDLRSGLVLIQVTNQIVFESLIENTQFYYLKPIYKNPKFKIQKLEILSDYLKFCQLILNIQTDTISADDIHDGNQKLILGLVWSLFLFSTNTSMNISTSFFEIKTILKNWINGIIKPRNMSISNFSKDWSLQVSQPTEILRSIFRHYHINLPNESMAEILEFCENEFYVPHLIDIDDFKLLLPDEKCIVPFIVELFKIFEIENGSGTPHIPQSVSFDSIESPQSIKSPSAKPPSITTPQLTSSRQSMKSPISKESSLNAGSPNGSPSPVITFSSRLNLQAVTSDDPKIVKVAVVPKNQNTPNTIAQEDGKLLPSLQPSKSTTSNDSNIEPNKSPNEPVTTLFCLVPSVACSNAVPTISFKCDDMIKMLVHTNEVKQKYENEASQFINKVNSVIFELTSLLAINDPSDKLHQLISSLSGKTLVQFSADVLPMIKQLNEIILLLSVFENYVSNDKPRLLDQDFPRLVNDNEIIGKNLSQINLHYTPTVDLYSLENIKYKATSLIELDLEISEYIVPIIENLKLVELNKVLEVFDKAMMHVENDQSTKQVIIQSMGEIDSLIVISNKLEVYHKIFKLNVQPQDIHQLLESKPQVQKTEYDLYEKSYEQFKTFLGKSEVNYNELKELFDSMELSQDIQNDFIRMIPINNYPLQNDSDFELDTSFASSCSISSDDEFPFDSYINGPGDKFQSNKLYDLDGLIAKINNGFCV